MRSLAQFSIFNFNTHKTKYELDQQGVLLGGTQFGCVCVTVVCGGLWTKRRKRRQGPQLPSLEGEGCAITWFSLLRPMLPSPPYLHFWVGLLILLLLQMTKKLFFSFFNLISLTLWVKLPPLYARVQRALKLMSLCSLSE